MITAAQAQKYKVKVLVKKVNINIKFPCSLTVQLKFQSFSQLKKSYQIVNGECTINDSLEIDIQIPENGNKRFEEKKILLYVFMISQSGRISAGYAHISLINRQIGHTFQQVQFLEKCPDKNAKIFFNYHVEIIRSKSERLDKTIINDLKFNDIKPISAIQQNRTKYQGNSNLINPNDSYRNRHELKGTINNSIDESHVQLAIGDQRKKKGVPNQRFQTDYLRERGSQSRSRNKSRNNVKQLKNIHSHLPLTTVNQISGRYTQQGQQDEDIETFKLKQKLKYAEKMQKVGQQNMRDLKDENQKRKNKITYLQNINYDLQKQIKQVQQKLKRTQKETKQLKDEKQQMLNQLKSLKHQIDLKQNILKQQLKKMEQKYKQSETQREKAVESYNKILKNTEQNQKKHQLIIKQKDKAFTEQRNKSNKSIQLSNNKISSLQVKIKSLESLIQDNKKQLKLSSLRETSLKEILQQTTSKNQQNLQKNNKNLQKINNLEDQIKVLKQIEVQKLLLKKKNNQYVLQNHNLVEKIAKFEKTMHLQEQKYKQIQMQLGKKTAEKTQLNNKLLSLKKSNDELKRIQQQKSKQIQSANFIHSSNNNRILQLKSKLDQEKRHSDQMHKQFQHRLSELILIKQNLQGQLEEVNWELKKNIATMQEVNNQVKTFNQLNYKLNEQLIEKNQKIKKLQQNVKQLTISNEYLTQSSSVLEDKKKQQLNVIKNMTFELGSNKKKLQKAQQQLCEHRDKFKLYESSAKDKLSDLQKRIKQKEQFIQNKNTDYFALENRCKQGQDENTLLKQNMSALHQELMFSKQTLSLTKRQLQAKEMSILKMKQNENTLKRQLVKRQQQLNKQGELNQQLKSELKRQIQQYKTGIKNINDNMTSYLMQLIKHQQQNKLINTNKIYYSSINQKILQLQIQFINKRNNSLLRHKSIEQNLFKQKQQIKHQFSKLLMQYEEQKLNNQQYCLTQHQKTKRNSSENIKTINSYKQSLQKCQQTIANQHKYHDQIKIQLANSQQQKSQLQMQLKLIINQYQMIKQQNTVLEQKILKIKTEQIRYRSMQEHKYQNLYEANESQKQKYIKEINQLQHVKLAQGKVINQCQDELKKQQYQQSIAKYQQQKMQQKLLQLQQKLQQMSNDLKAASSCVKQKQRQIKRLLQNNEQLSKKLTLQKQKCQQCAFKNQSLNDILFNLQKQHQQSRQQIIQLNRISENNSIQSKIKMQSLKNQQDKFVAQIKELKQKNITVNSELEMNKFVVKQLQNALKIQKQSKEQIKQQFYNKKNEKAKLQLQINIVKSKLSSNQSELSQLKNQNLIINKTLQKLKYQNQQLKNYQKNSLNNNKIAALQKQKQRLQGQNLSIHNNYQKIINDLKLNLNQYKKNQILRHNQEEELKKKLKVAQKMLQTNNSTAHHEYKKICQQLQKQRRELIGRNQSYQIKIRNLQEELSRLKQKSRKQLQKSFQAKQQLQEQFAAAQQTINKYTMELNNINYLYNQLASQKNRIQGDSKQQIQKLSAKIKQKQSNIQTLKNKLKSTQLSQNKQLIQGIQNELSKIKAKKMNLNGNEMERLLIINSYKQIDEILREMKKTNHVNGTIKHY